MIKTEKEIKSIVITLANFLTGGICDLCGLPELTKKNGKYHRGGSFVIHHHKYKKKNGIIIEKIHSDFTSRLEYHKYLEKMVRKQPKRFKIFHNKCHFAVEKTAKWRPDRRKKLFKLAEEIYKNNYLH